MRWINAEHVHTAIAYHPRNDQHSLRIPEKAVPWDSGYLRAPGQRFEVTLRVEGVYDYFCTPHEGLGMVGRIVVGKPGGPGTLPFDYFEGKPGRQHWQPMPLTAQKGFPSVAAVMAQGRAAGSAPRAARSLTAVSRRARRPRRGRDRRSVISTESITPAGSDAERDHLVPDVGDRIDTR